MKKKIILIISLILIVILAIGSVFLFKYLDEQERLKEEKRINELIKDIKSHYGEYVITKEETKLYKKEKEKYTEFGKINKEVKLTLEEIKIDENTKYFYIPELDSYIKYKSVEPTEEYKKDDRYTNYIYFNKNITTKETTTFYDSNDKYLYTLNKSFDFQVLVNDNDRYGVVYNNELLYVKSEDVENVYDNHNTDLKNKSRLKTLTYHFIYNPETYDCNQSICQSFEQFESHLKYIRENDYFTLKLDEMEMYLDGKIQIPHKSIVLTIDDGTIFDTGAIDLLEKYDVDATMFVITSWVGTDHLQSNKLHLESHTDNMHNQYECAGYGSQGGGILCLPEEKVLQDLKTSQDKLGGSKYFAYPFFDFNDRAISLLKEAGFHMAFIGQYTTDGYSYPNKTDKYKVPRKTIFSFTSMNEFISYLN